MNIIIDARTIDFTGIGTYIKNLLYGLNEIDSKNKYFVILKNNQEIIFNLNSNFVIYRFSSKVFSIGEQIEFFSLFRKLNKNHQIDIFHAPHFNIPLYLPSNVKLITTIHDLAFFFFPEFRNFLYKIYYDFFIKRVFRRSKKIITVSNYTKKTVSQIFGDKLATKCVTVYPGFINNIVSINDKRLSTDILIQKKINKKYFLYVGVNKPRKNLKFLAETFKELYSNTSFDSQLVIVGKIDPSFFDFKKFIDKNNLQNKIILTGYVPNEMLGVLYSNAIAFVYPSLLEGFGYPILEAQSYNIPVLAAKTSSLLEVGLDSCIFFDSQDINNLKKIILKVSKFNANDIKTIIKKGRTNITRFKPEISGANTLEQYKKIKN